jgi:hypothetical protein
MFVLMSGVFGGDSIVLFEITYLSAMSGIWITLESTIDLHLVVEVKQPICCADDNA